MDWKQLLAYITGTVDQELLLRNEYLVTENRILRNQMKGLCSAITPSSSLWTLTLAARIIVRDHNLAAEGHLGHDTMHESAS